MRNTPPSVIIATLGMIVGLIALVYQTSSLMGALFFFPFVMGPLVVTAALGSWLRGRRCQDFLMLGSILYIGWVVWMWVDVFHRHPDPQSAIVLLFVGAYALPVLLPLWIVAWFKRERTPRTEAATPNNEKA
jgi:hypothetical protein